MNRVQTTYTANTGGGRIAKAVDNGRFLSTVVALSLLTLSLDVIRLLWTAAWTAALVPILRRKRTRPMTR